ncbi:GGDEF domain-containing protein [Leadbettera azotonutricia]|uniref:diguanylate cyclase n=1 Tax=Leadbettera azotonutricia (strain ATCC BAA-888 / DSM 13862 / ZAS-9) TaxID=545695 RepID=F5Y8R4_LEAAZ|nr:GGDEF domain-containing protein [Leadbettera azotonutricia]AEF83192.1 diguanylate cyclase (GGDEF) domain protein [Leadbettera azotonutricia ZAS-9]
MNFIPLYLNTAIGAVFIIILIFLDYIRKYNTDDFQRLLFICVLGAGFLATIADFLNRTMGGIPGHNIRITLYAVNSLFYVFQNIAYYSAIIFIDYFAYGDEGRTKRFIKIAIYFLVLYCVSVIVNLSLHYYFYISVDNIYTHGPLYNLRLIISYLSIPLCIMDMAFSSKSVKSSQIGLIALFGVITGAGAGMDVLFKSGSLAWPCFAAALLYIYFFIIRSDSKIDSLTGIGNRIAFNEFIEKISRRNVKGRPASKRRFPFPWNRTKVESWAVVMIDMDHFKQINDTLGHLEGDNALRDMASIIKSSVRSTDFAARYGGDEFILATPAKSNVDQLMSRLRTALASHNAKAGRPYTLEISYGCDIFTAGSGQSIDEFLAHIDSLMYKQKADRRRASDDKRTR